MSDNILSKVTTLYINLNIDDDPVDSHTHTHPSHSQNSHVIFTSLSWSPVYIPPSSHFIRL